MKNNSTKNSEFTLRFSSKVNIEDSMLFFFNRLIFLEDQLFIQLYNREVEIGNTNEVFQVFYFMSMDRIFNRKFGKSPIVLNREQMLLTVKGKVYLTKTGFELENNKYDFSVKNNTRHDKVKEGKIIMTKERRAYLQNEIAKQMGRDPEFKERVLKMIEENKQNIKKL